MISGVTIINEEKKLYPVFQANEIASELQSGDEDWTYRVVIEGKRAYIEIIDEDGEFVSYWNASHIITKINGVNVLDAVVRPT